jgi:hypothetical protein
MRKVQANRYPKILTSGFIVTVTLCWELCTRESYDCLTVPVLGTDTQSFPVKMGTCDPARWWFVHVAITSIIQDGY